jgi:hypothetical protein
MTSSLASDSFNNLVLRLISNVILYLGMNLTSPCVNWDHSHHLKIIITLTMIYVSLRLSQKQGKAGKGMERRINSNEYNDHNYRSMVLKCTHLSVFQQFNSLELFLRYTSLFDLLVDKNWFAYYPRPRLAIFDNGSEFSFEFLELLHKSTTVKNPQTNTFVDESIRLSAPIFA